MAFLDNSGDIILDAVLTDTGRYRLAKGDGSFKIVKFALGDDEINYGSYNKNNPSGSAYYDLQILQTPVLEAFTNNTSTMKSKLISIPRTNLLYLPVMKLSGDANGKMSGSSTGAGATNPSGWNTNFVVCVNLETAGAPGNTTQGILDGSSRDSDIQGFMNGYDPTAMGSYIRIDQGLDTSEIPPQYTIDADLNETQYIIEIDNRFGSIVSAAGNGTIPNVTSQRANVSFIDDDNIASYYLSQNTDINFIASAIENNTEIAGPRGTMLQFKIQASTDLATSTFLFEQLGSTGYSVYYNRNNGATGRIMNLRYIDSIVKVTGATTGYSLNIPVRFVRYISDDAA